MKKILVVDDEENIVFALRLLLEKSGYEVLTASDGLMALEVYQKFKPDVVLLDIMMPKLDGFETAKEFRKLDVDSQLRIIFLSAKGATLDKMVAYEKGGDDYIVKPSNNTEILEKIEDLL